MTSHPSFPCTLHPSVPPSSRDGQGVKAVCAYEIDGGILQLTSYPMMFVFGEGTTDWAGCTDERGNVRMQEKVMLWVALRLSSFSIREGIRKRQGGSVKSA